MTGKYTDQSPMRSSLTRRTSQSPDGDRSSAQKVVRNNEIMSEETPPGGHFAFPIN
jgi:hypothetical protein